MKKIFIVFTLIIFILSSCADFLDVNDDPNSPSDVTDYLILPAAQASVVNVFSADYGILGSFFSQHWAQNNTSSQYKVLETYTLGSNDGFVDRPYIELYSNGLSDNEIILKKAKEEENWGVYLMAATLKAYAFQYLVDLYDNVPYVDAFKGENEKILNPKLNTGQEVYTAIYQLLNEAISKVESEDFQGIDEGKYGKFDLLMGADIDRWYAFANSLKLRILLRQYSVNTTFVENELTDLLDNGTFIDADVALTNFEDADSKSNPLYESDQRQLNTKNNIRANATLVSYLKANSDTRLSALFSPVGGTILGMITGSYEVPSSEFEAPDIISQPRLTPTMPAYLMTVAESELLLAEAYLRLGFIAEATDHYDAGVESSFDRMGANSTNMVDSIYKFPALGTFAEQLEAIIMQKWIDCADGQRGIESFIEQVRTGIPKVSQVSSEISPGYILPASYIPGTLIYSKKGATGGKFPIRLPYPDAELNYNSNAAAFKNLSDADVMQTKVWWNQ